MRFRTLSENGYTLIEIVVVIVVLGIIGGVTFQIVASGVEAFKKSSARKELYDQGRLALERMVRELRDAKEVTASGNDNITFKVAHPSAYSVTEEIKYQLNGTALERVADPSGSATTAVLASSVSGFTVTPEDIGGGGGTGTCSINYDAASSDSGSGSQLTFSHTIGEGSNRLLVVSVGIENGSSGPTVSSITYGGQNLTKIDSVQTGFGTIGRSELWYALETNLPSAGSYNVEVNVSASVSYLLAGAISLDGVAQQAPEDKNTNTANTNDDISTSITTVTNGAWIVDSVHCGEGGSYTANSGQAERYEPGSSSSTHAASTLPKAIAGSTSISWTHSVWDANRQTHVVAAFAPATDCVGSTVAGDLVMVTGTGDFSGGEDAYKKTLFEGWGWTVTALEDNTADYSTAAANNDLMYISESVGSYTVGDKATYLDIGVVSEENAIDDDMEFSSSPLDRYDAGGTQTDIVDNSHYITSPFSTGLLTIYTSSTNNWENEATIASGAEVLAEGVGTNFAAVMAFETGATLDDLSSAVNRRVALTAFHQSDPTLWTNDAKTLIMRALDWAAGAGAGNVATLELTLSSSEGGTVTMRTKVFLRNLP